MKLLRYARMAVVAGSSVALIALPHMAGAQAPAAGQGDPAGRGAIDAQELGLYYGEATGLGTQSLQETIASIIRVALSLLGIVAVVIILIGGFKWMTAGGNEDEVAKARQWILNGTIGLAIILSAFAITKFVIESLSTAVQG